MNGLSASLTELDRIIQGSRELAGLVELMVCPPATLLARFAAAARGTASRGESRRHVITIAGTRNASEPGTHMRAAARA